MRPAAVLVTMLAALGACRGDVSPPGGDDVTPIDAAVPDAAPQADAGPAGELRFAIVGDTRPVNEDDTPHYPTGVITRVWDDVEGLSPPADFAISTGDYMFASTAGEEQNPQLDAYLGARAHYHGRVYPVMGNHECTGATASNCATSATRNYTAFMTRMVAPLGFATPYYKVDLAAPDRSWTAKIVVIAANAWADDAQGVWLEHALSEDTTYTFVIRHEGATATTAPGVPPSATIIARHPMTLLIVGHTHTYAHYPDDREVICGNGGAPLTSGADYGYGVVERLGDGTIQFTERDYITKRVVDQWRVHADGTLAP